MNLCSCAWQHDALSTEPPQWVYTEMLNIVEAENTDELVENRELLAPSVRATYVMGRVGCEHVVTEVVHKPE